MPLVPPPPPPRNFSSSATAAKKVASSSSSASSDLLAAIQKGTKLKKAVVTNDRSAPVIQKASNAVVEAGNRSGDGGGLGMSKFVSEASCGAGAGGGLMSEIQQKLSQRRKNEGEVTKERETDTKPTNEIRKTNEIRRTNNALNTNIQPTNNAQRTNQEFPSTKNRETQKYTQSSNKPSPSTPKQASFQNEKPQLRPIHASSAHKFDLSAVPKTPPKIKWPSKCTYPSGERSGLNRFIQNPAQLPFMMEEEEALNPRKKAETCKSTISKALQLAIAEEDFEKCVELKAAIKLLDDNSCCSIEQIDRIMRKLRLEPPVSQ